MTRSSRPLVALSLLLGIALGVILMLWRERKPSVSAPGPAAVTAAPVTKALSAETAASVLAGIPPVTGNSAADREISKWTERARKGSGDNTVWVRLGDALMQKARESAAPHYYRHAEKAYAKALERNPGSAEAMTGLAWVHGGRHEFDRSIHWARKAIAQDPKNNEAHGLLGDAYQEMGDYDAAFEHYQTMLDIRPDLASYSRGAHLLYLTGDTRKGMWLMNKAVQSGAPYAENTAWCRAELARMLFDYGALVPAEQVLRDALKHAPDNPHVLSGMGRVRAARKDYAGAISSYRKAVAIAPEPKSVIALGDLYQLTGKRDEAEKQYALVEKLYQQHGHHDDHDASTAVHHSHATGEEDSAAHNSLPLARFYADHDRSLKLALRLAEAHKTSRNVYDADTLAWCYYKNGKYGEAKAAIQKALRLNTPDASILYHAGMIYARLGERVTAQKYLHRATSLNPNFDPIHAPIALAALSRMNQLARAN